MVDRFVSPPPFSHPLDQTRTPEPGSLFLPVLPPSAADEKWTPHETSYLFSLLKEYDLRFLIVADRYAYLPPGGTSGQDVNVFTKSKKGEKNGLAVGSLGGPGTAGTGTGAMAGSRRSVRAGGRGSRQQTPSTGSTPVTNTTTTPLTNLPAAPVRETDVKRRSIEEIKDRYYTVCRRLIRNRPALDEAVKERMVRAFDYDLRESAVVRDENDEIKRKRERKWDRETDTLLPDRSGGSTQNPPFDSIQSPPFSHAGVRIPLPLVETNGTDR
jgi:hypothetical protein